MILPPEWKLGTQGLKTEGNMSGIVEMMQKIGFSNFQFCGTVDVTCTQFQENIYFKGCLKLRTIPSINESDIFAQPSCITFTLSKVPVSNFCPTSQILTKSNSDVKVPDVRWATLALRCRIFVFCVLPPSLLSVTNIKVAASLCPPLRRRRQP